MMSPMRIQNLVRFAPVALLVFMLDQVSKYWLVTIYKIGAKSPVIISENFSLVMAWNRGVSFSMLTHDSGWMPLLLVAMAVIISGVLLWLALNSAHRLERVGYAMVVGGALGNACDRVRFGAVADFFYAHVGDLGWPAFNVADMAICAGVALLLFSMVKHPARP
ncbi:MAG: signal peptidase II [Rickettsiales bacterium]